MDAIYTALRPWIAIGVSVSILAGLQLRRATPPEMLFLFGLMIVTLTGLVAPDKALAGFANQGVLTIAGLLVVSSALRYSGVLDAIGQRLLGGIDTVAGGLGRIAMSVVPSSAFLLNTALVPMMMPVILDWCRQRKFSPSQFLLPLSYFCILGGVCSLIGTSTNLVTQGMLRNETDRREQMVREFREKAILSELKQLNRAPTDENIAAFLKDQPEIAAELAGRERFLARVAPMSLFEIGWVGIPCAIVGTIYLVFFGRYLLPDKTDPMSDLEEHRREYLVEMLVLPECGLIGKAVEEAGLRQLPGLFLIEINRAGDVVTPVTPRDMIHANDRLIFTGVVSTIIDLEKIPGLIPAADESYEFHPHKRQQRQLIEVVIARSSPCVGRTIRDANFRELYNAAVVAVHRNGARLPNKIGDIILEPGDTLLLQTRGDFVETHANNPDFYLVRNVEGSEPRRHDKGWLAGTLTLLLILWLTGTSWLPVTGPLGALGNTAIASIFVALLLIAFRCIPIAGARDSLDLQTLITIAASLGVGLAMSESGAAKLIADAVVGLATQVASDDWRPYVLLAMIYILGAVMTEMITNNAVAAMLFPLAVTLAEAGHYSPRPFIMAITLAASMSFCTPIGYQTNLMVMGPGGYQPSDYLKAGLPLALLMAVVALTIIPWAWPF